MSTVAELNDAFRSTFKGGQIMMTSGVQALSRVTRGRIVYAILTFDFASAPAGNDPYLERDFGHVEPDGIKVFWKIDYYDSSDPSMETGSEDPADPSKTTRVLTIMLAEEY